MLLIGITEEPGWIRSTFNLTYRVSWETLLKGVRGVYPYMRDVSQNADNPEILVDDEIIQISSPDEILAIPEAGSITIRGFVPVIKTAACWCSATRYPSSTSPWAASARNTRTPTTKSSTSRWASSWTLSRS